MSLSKKLTVVTPFSKYLAMFLFIAFPFIGFYLGVMYQTQIDMTQQLLKNTMVNNTTQTIIPQNLQVLSLTARQYGISFTISPTYGSVGTKVKVSISGVVGNSEAPYADIGFSGVNGVDNDVNKPNYAFNTTKFNGNKIYETTYIIPDKVLVDVPGGRNPSVYVPLVHGPGNFTFNYAHPTYGDIEIDVPFDVTSN